MYRPPIKDIRFVLHELIGDFALAASSKFPDYSPELADTVLEEAGKFAENVLEPLNQSGDRQGAQWTPDGVVSAKGFKAAYRQFADDGWASLRAIAEFGGQGAPLVLGTAVEELWAGANLAFKLCPMLTQGAVEALEHFGTRDQKQRFLPKMVAGEWTGTMNLTEPHAGSDLGLLRTRAVRDGDRYRMFGQKIFITYGDHDYTSNIIHMVLARIDGAPAGVRGISLFIVPKVMVNDDSSLGARNDVQCISIEHKLGIHGSPTCVMAYGQKDGAVGYLLGTENRGLECMFVMMNAARLSVGLEGYAIAERAYQLAASWARTRVQGKPPGVASSAPLPIIHHPDIKRMLLLMKSQTEAMRALAIYAAFCLDRGDARGDLLIPVVKGWSTETGIEVASLGIQVHGGMGFIEETGAAQMYRDVRITTIYEGTTGIQSNDLIGRKMARDGGAVFAALIADMRRELAALRSVDAGAVAARQAAVAAVELLDVAAKVILTGMASSPAQAFAVSAPFLKMCGIVMGGWLLAKSADIAATKLAVGESDREFLSAKIQTAAFYAAQVLPQAAALQAIVQDGAAGVLNADAALI